MSRPQKALLRRKYRKLSLCCQKGSGPQNNSSTTTTNNTASSTISVLLYHIFTILSFLLLFDFCSVYPFFIFNSVPKKPLGMWDIKQQTKCNQHTPKYSYKNSTQPSTQPILDVTLDKEQHKTTTVDILDLLNLRRPQE